MKYFILAQFLTAMTAAHASTEPAKTVYLPIRAVPDSLDPTLLKTDTASNVFRQVAEGLFATGEGFQVYPRLADSMEWSPDQKTLKIRLRNTKFSDGTPVTVNDVIQAMAYCMKNAEKTLLIAVRAIEGYQEYTQGRAKLPPGIIVKGPSEIEIRLSHQAPLLLYDLAQADCHVLKPLNGGPRDLLKGALGSGPYRLKNVTGTEVILERNPNYYLPIQGPDEAIFRRTEDFGHFEKLKSWVTMGTTEYRPTGDSDFHEFEFSDLGTHQLILNNSKPPFNDVRVRRAVSLALDYSNLAEKLGWSADTLQAGLVPLGMPGFRKRNVEDRAKSLSQTRKLLKEAGYSSAHPLKFSILISHLGTYEKEISIWPTLFHGVPIDARVEAVDHAERNARQDRGEFQAIRGIKFAGSIESHRILSSYMSGSAYNPTRSHESKCDALTLESVSTVDQNARFKQYERADQCLMDRAILVPLASIQPGYVFLKKPWKLSRTNRYLLYPYWISEWRQDAEK